MMQFTVNPISASGFHRLAWGEGAALTLGGRRGPIKICAAEPASSQRNCLFKIVVPAHCDAIQYPHRERSYRLPSRFGSPGCECRRLHAHEHAREAIRDAENSIRLHGKTIREEAHDFQC